MHTPPTRLVSLPSIAAGLVVLAVSLGVGAQERERGSVMFGMFITDRATDARVDAGDGSSGSDVDLEGDLGLESSSSVARLGGYYWFKARQRVDVSYFNLSRDASLPINKTIDFGDQTFPINTVVTTNNDLTIGKIDYTWAFLNRDKGYLGIVAGLYIASVKLSLSEPTLGRAESEGLTAPLPVIGLRGEYALGKHFTLRGASQWFGIDTGSVSGRLLDTYFGADYGFGKHMSVGLAYNDVGMNISAEGSRTDFSGEFNWGYDGFLLYVKADFGKRASK